MAKLNTGFRAKPKGLCVFMKSAKSLGFCFLAGQRKKENQKISLCAWRKANASLPPLCS